MANDRYGKYTYSKTREIGIPTIVPSKEVDFINSEIQKYSVPQTTTEVKPKRNFLDQAGDYFKGAGYAIPYTALQVARTAGKNIETALYNTGNMLKNPAGYYDFIDDEENKRWGSASLGEKIQMLTTLTDKQKELFVDPSTEYDQTKSYQTLTPIMDKIKENANLTGDVLGATDLGFATINSLPYALGVTASTANPLIGALATSFLIDMTQTSMMEDFKAQGMDIEDPKVRTRALADATSNVLLEYTVDAIGGKFLFEPLKKYAAAVSAGTIKRVPAIIKPLLNTAEAMNKYMANKGTIPTVARMGSSMAKVAVGEGSENVIQDFASAVIAKVTTNPDTPFEELFGLEDEAKSFGAGAIIGMIMRSPTSWMLTDTQKKYRDLKDKDVNAITTDDTEDFRQKLLTDGKKQRVQLMLSDGISKAMSERVYRLNAGAPVTGTYSPNQLANPSFIAGEAGVPNPVSTSAYAYQGQGVPAYGTAYGVTQMPERQIPVQTVPKRLENKAFVAAPAGVEAAAPEDFTITGHGAATRYFGEQPIAEIPKKSQIQVDFDLTQARINSLDDKLRSINDELKKAKKSGKVSDRLQLRKTNYEQEIAALNLKLKTLQAELAKPSVPAAPVAPAPKASPVAATPAPTPAPAPVAPAVAAVPEKKKAAKKTVEAKPVEKPVATKEEATAAALPDEDVEQKKSQIIESISDIDTKIADVESQIENMSTVRPTAEDRINKWIEDNVAFTHEKDEMGDTEDGEILGVDGKKIVWQDQETGNEKKTAISTFVKWLKNGTVYTDAEPVEWYDSLPDDTDGKPQDTTALQQRLAALNDQRAALEAEYIALEQPTAAPAAKAEAAPVEEVEKQVAAPAEEKKVNAKKPAVEPKTIKEDPIAELAKRIADAPTFKEKLGVADAALKNYKASLKKAKTEDRKLQLTDVINSLTKLRTAIKERYDAEVAAEREAAAEEQRNIRKAAAAQKAEPTGKFSYYVDPETNTAIKSEEVTFKFEDEKLRDSRIVESKKFDTEKEAWDYARDLEKKDLAARAEVKKVNKQQEVAKPKEHVKNVKRVILENEAYIEADDNAMVDIQKMYMDHQPAENGEVKVNIVEQNQMTDLEKKLYKIVKAISNRRTVFYTVKNYAGNVHVNGVYYNVSADRKIETGYKDNIYILRPAERSTRARNSVSDTVYHELVHNLDGLGVAEEFKEITLQSLGVSKDASINDLAKALYSLYMQNENMTESRARNLVNGYLKSNKESIQRRKLLAEIVAEKGSFVLTDAEFWRAYEAKLGKKSGSILEKIKDWLRKAFNASSSNAEIDAMIKALDAAKAAPTVYEEYLQHFKYDMEDIQKTKTAFDSIFSDDEVMQDLFDDMKFDVPKYTGSTSDPYKVENPKTAEALKAARGIPKTEKVAFVKKVADYFDANVVKGAFNLDNTKYSRVRARLNGWVSSKSTANEEAMSSLKKIYTGETKEQALTKEQLNLMEHAVLFLDVAEDIKNNLYDGADAVIPFMIGSKENAMKEIAKVRAYLNDPKNKVVVDALKRRKQIIDETRNKLIKAAKNVNYDLSWLNAREQWFRHDVRHFYNEDGKALQRAQRGTARYKGREGTKSNYLTDSKLVDFIALRQMESEIIKLELYKEVLAFNVIKSQQLKWNQAQHKFMGFNEKTHVMYDKTRLGLRFSDNDQVSLRIAKLYQQAQAQQIDTNSDAFKAILDRGVAMEKDNYIVIPIELAQALDVEFLPKQAEEAHKAFQSVTSTYKRWALNSIHRTFKYNVTNFLGDSEALLMTFPKAVKYIPQATKELVEYFKTGRIGEMLGMYVHLGGMSTSMSEVEVGEFDKAPTVRAWYGETDPQAWARRGKELIGLITGNNTTVKKITEVREQVLRYAAFMHNYAALKESNGIVKNYGASLKGEIDGLETIADKAYKLSNDALGAYNDVSRFGQQLSKTIMPFYRFKEVNARRTFRIMRNLFALDDANVNLTRGQKILATTKAMVKASPMAALRAGKVYGFYLAGMAAMQAWNHMPWNKEDEDALTEEQQAQPHIMLPFSASKAVYVSNISAMNQFYQDFGLRSMPDIYKDVQDLMTGRMSITEKMTEIADDAKWGVASSFINGIHPAIKTTAEIATGKSVFPSVKSPVPIRDSWEYLFGTLGLKAEYKALTGKPLKGGTYFGEWDNTLATSVATDDAYMYSVYEMLNKYQDDNGMRRQASVKLDDKSMAAYYYKQSLKLKDWGSADKWLKKYALAGGTMKTLNKSLDALDPTMFMKGPDKVKFLSQLTKEEREKYDKAMKYIKDLKQLSITTRQ